VELIGEALWDALHLLLRGDRATLRIAALSLLVSGTATVFATLLGVPLGALLATRRFRGARLVTGIVNTGMGLPPVVVGLGVMILLWRNGPLGDLRLLYTPTAMVLAQLIVATPIAAGYTASSLRLLDSGLVAALRVDGARESRVLWEMVCAARPQVLVAVAAAFGRALSEVGASLMVGGNLLHSTRILTTAITLETSKGEFARAIALGAILLALSFVVNAALVRGSGLSPKADV
jgi:tungstate transport system permease protein